MIVVLIVIAVFALVLSLAIIARPTEFDQARPHEGATIAAQRRRELWDRNQAQEQAARPEADVIEFPDRTGGAA